MQRDIILWNFYSCNQQLSREIQTMQDEAMAWNSAVELVGKSLARVMQSKNEINHDVSLELLHLRKNCSRNCHSIHRHH